MEKKTKKRGIGNSLLWLFVALTVAAGMAFIQTSG